MVDTNKEIININKLICEKEEILLIEGDMIVPDSKPDILSTINTSGNICIYKKEIENEKIKIDGNINAYIMYVPDNAQDKVRGINTSLDFSEVIDAPKCKNDMILEMTTEINNIDCNVINGRKINIKAGIRVKFKVFTNEEIAVVNKVLNNDEIQVLKDNIKVNSLVGCGNTKAYVKDTIMIDNTDNMAEILKVNINMIDKDIKTSYNKVLAKTDLEIKIMYLTEDDRIVTCTNKIPLVGFVDIQNVSDDNICNTNFIIRNMIIKPNNIDEHSIYVEFEVEAFCMAYEEKEFCVLKDLYSPIQELECTKKKFGTISNKKSRKDICKINENTKLSELEGGELIDTDCTPRIKNVTKSKTKIMYDGELEINFTIVGQDTQIITRKVNLPFEFSIEPGENCENINIETLLEMGNKDFLVKSGGEVTLSTDIIFNTNMWNKIDMNIIDDIELTENTNIEDYSLIIYIVKKGDTLWNIAKKLKSTVEDIVKANAIEDPNMIKEGEKLYIPKYIKMSKTEQAMEPKMMNYA